MNKDNEYHRRRVKELEQANRNNLDAWANEVGHLHGRIAALEDAIQQHRADSRRRVLTKDDIDALVIGEHPRDLRLWSLLPEENDD